MPPLIRNGFKEIGTHPAIVANFAGVLHDAVDVERRDPFDSAVAYNWGLNHR